MGGKEPFVKEYRNSHKSFAAKMVIWSRFANLLLLEAEKKHLVTKSDNDGAWSINLHRQSNENDEGIENYNEKHQEYLNKFEEIYVPVKDALKKGKSV